MKSRVSVTSVQRRVLPLSVRDQTSSRYFGLSVPGACHRGHLGSGNASKCATFGPGWAVYLHRVRPRSSVKRTPSMVPFRRLRFVEEPTLNSRPLAHRPSGSLPQGIRVGWAFAQGTDAQEEAL